MNVGDKVWLFYPRTPRGLSPKLTKHWTGPFIIKRQTSEVDYLIKEENRRKSFIVHHNRLKICTAPTESSTESTCSPTNAEEQADQEDSIESHHWNTDDDLIAIIPADSEVVHSFGGHREVASLQTDLETMCMTMMILP